MTESIANSGIAAQAFRFLEMQPISSFGDDSEEAAAAADQYPVAADACFARADWSFARKLALLPPVVPEEGDVADPDLPGLFLRPTDLVAVRQVWPQGVVWRLDADRLRADQAAALTIRYTARVRDETRLPGNFKTAVAAHLASLLAPRWTTSANRAQALLDTSNVKLLQAIEDDRGSASQRRYDGSPRQCDWSAEAVR